MQRNVIKAEIRRRLKGLHVNVSQIRLLFTYTTVTLQAERHGVTCLMAVPKSALNSFETQK